MDVSDLLAITFKKFENKGSQIGYTKKIFKKHYLLEAFSRNVTLNGFACHVLKTKVKRLRLN
jgi:hypothetical protein